MRGPPKLEWASALREHLRKCELAEPVPERKTLSPLDEQKCRILGGHLVQWLQKWGPPLIQERSVVIYEDHMDHDPLVLVLTDTPGLVAARQIFKPTSEHFISGRREHIRAFEAQWPDEEFTIHCELESYFEELEVEREKELRAEYNLPADAIAGSHYDCSTLLPLFARGGRHLWTFTENECNLVAECYDQWIS